MVDDIHVSFRYTLVEVVVLVKSGDGGGDPQSPSRHCLFTSLPFFVFLELLCPAFIWYHFRPGNFKIFIFMNLFDMYIIHGP